LNHDIIPGLLFLIMIFLCHRWLNCATTTTGLWLVSVGAAVTFIKQTFALFWAVLILYAFIAYVLKWDNQRVTVRKLGMLFTLAAISAMLSWLGWGIWLVEAQPIGEPHNVADNSFITQPLALIQTIFKLYGSVEMPTFSQDLYLRNIHNYGIAAMSLIIPGLIAAFYHQNTRLRMVAVCWVLSVVIMHLIPFKEVRYLLFLAPLTTALILPIIQSIVRQHILIIVFAVFMLIDQGRGWSLAAKQLVSTAEINVTRFFDAPQNNGRAIVSQRLSFVFMADSPLVRDTYHGMYHISAVQLYFMHENNLQVVELSNPQNLGQIGLKSGDRIYYANTMTMRLPPWPIANNRPYAFNDLKLVSGDAVSIEFIRQGDEYIAKGREGQLVMYVPDKTMGQMWPVITSSHLTFKQAQQLYGNGQQLDGLRVVAVMVKGLCQFGQCVYDHVPD